MRIRSYLSENQSNSLLSLQHLTPNQTRWTRILASIAAIGIGADAATTITTIVLLPTIVGAIGLAGITAAIMVPALMVGMLSAYTEYKKMAKLKEKEKEEIECFNRHLQDFAPLGIEQKLQSYEIQIKEACDRLQKIDENKNAFDELAERTTNAIRSLQVLQGRPVMAEEINTLIDGWRGTEDYRQTFINNLQSIALVKLKPVVQRGFIKTLYYDLGSFKTKLNHIRRKQGWFAIFGYACEKIWEKASPFLGAMGIGITLGGGVLGIFSVALSATGFGAIGGVPLLLASIGIVLGSMSIGVGAAAVDHYATACKEKTIMRLKHNQTILLEAKRNEIALKDYLCILNLSIEIEEKKQEEQNDSPAYFEKKEQTRRLTSYQDAQHLSHHF